MHLESCYVRPERGQEQREQLGLRQYRRRNAAVSAASLVMSASSGNWRSGGFGSGKQGGR